MAVIIKTVSEVWHMPKRGKLTHVSIEDYLRLEEQSNIRHEYIDGQLFAMTGARQRHEIIVGNVFSIIRSHVKGSPCRAFMSNMKVRVEATNSFYYPDVLISCGNYQPDNSWADNAVFISEVLSPSTATIDRREKVIAYRQISTLQQYLIVYQSRQKVELHSRQKEGDWDVTEFVKGENLLLTAFPSGDLSLPIDAIYEDTEAPNKPNLEVRELVAAGWLEEEIPEW